MENTISDHLEPPAVPAVQSTIDDHQENILPQDTATDMVMDCKQETVKDEGRKILEVIASTGKFWLEWEELKSLLSHQLKQVLSEYPEVKMSKDEQISLLGETYEDLVNKLDEALCSFIEGPPFTLQRLCEIILGAKDIYPKLFKLSLALEKNLFVTSTLTICTDPYPPPITKVSEEVEKTEEPQPSKQNGVEHVMTDKDEATVKVEASDDKDEGKDDMQTDAVSEVTSEPTAPESAPTTPDPTPTTETKPADSQSL